MANTKNTTTKRTAKNTQETRVAQRARDIDIVINLISAKDSCVRKSYAFPQINILHPFIGQKIRHSQAVYYDDENSKRKREFLILLFVNEKQSVFLSDENRFTNFVSNFIKILVFDSFLAALIRNKKQLIFMNKSTKNEKFFRFSSS